MVAWDDNEVRQVVAVLMPSASGSVAADIVYASLDVATVIFETRLGRVSFEAALT